MPRRAWIGSACAALLVAAAAVPLWADTLKLKDGTTVTGRVMDEGASYWVKSPDGTSHMVAKESVQDWVKGDAPATPTAATPAAPAASSASALPDASAGGATFKAVKAKADRVDTPVQAVALWQSFIDAHPSPADAAAAKDQLAYWNQLLNGHAERVNGKWIWGAERDKLLKQVRTLLRQAMKDIDSNQTLTGIHELEQATKLYPNDQPF